ncbi:MAG: anthranilate phosphoribosyltransferase, partial [Epsilonproteobacteria bacterium]|nr:anthranilate phosphoribosyltransferase [Campylobacterota bacterium]
RATDAQRDIVLLNASYAIFADGKARDMKEALEIAKSGIESGRVKEHLKFIAELSNKI